MTLLLKGNSWRFFSKSEFLKLAILKVRVFFDFFKKEKAFLSH